MLKVNTNYEVACAALAHILEGLIKADAGLSVYEIEKIEILIYKMRHGLPAEYDDIMKMILHLHEDPDYKSWVPDTHLDKGLEYFDRFVNSGYANAIHLDAMYDLFEIIAEVGDLTEGEEKYLNRIYKEFSTKYGMKKDDR